MHFQYISFMAAELEILEADNGTALDDQHAAETQGKVVVRKRATSDHEHERFAHEAHMLQRASHPGVVEFISFDDETGTLRTQFAGDQTWKSSPPETLSELAKGVASVAATLSDLHTLAITHASLTADHIVLGADRRPILCDLSQAGDQDPSIDVAALGAVIHECLDQIGDGKPSTRKALAALADRASHTDPEKRPSAAALAAASRQLVQTSQPTAGRSSGSSIKVLAGAAVLMAALAVLFWPSADDPLAIATLDEALPVTNPPSPAPALSTQAADRPTTPSTTVAIEIPVEPLVLEHDGFRYAVGQSGDSAAIGDWDCDGAETAAILRPHSGQVYLFDTWPTDSETARVTPLTIPNSTATLDAGTDCGRLVLVDAAGEAVTLNVVHANSGADS